MRSGAAVAERPGERTFTEKARRAQIVQAAIETSAELGYGRASLARIAEKLGISKGVISYHFAGKDDLIKEVVLEVLESGKAYMRSRVDPESSGPEALHAYIESNLAFMGEHPNYMVAIVEIGRNGLSADGQRRFYGDADVDDAVRILEGALARFQAAGEMRQDFDPRVMAVAIRAAIDAVPRRLAHDPQLDVDNYAREIANLFDRATRVE